MLKKNDRCPPRLEIHSAVAREESQLFGLGLAGAAFGRMAVVERAILQWPPWTTVRGEEQLLRAAMP